jgi:hypothetical protein
MNQPVPTPENWEVVQQYEDYQPHVVPVDIQGIVATYQLPSKFSVMRKITVDTTTAIPEPNELIPADRRLKRAWIWTSSSNVIVGTIEQVMLATPDGFNLPANVAMPWEGFDKPVYGIATQSGPVAVNLRFEFWAD